jgi:glutamine synthetase
MSQRIRRDDRRRSDVDKLETTVADDLWPLPTYQEMLFIK